MPFYSVHSARAPKFSSEQQQLKQAFVNTGEEWDTTWQNILTVDPEYFSVYVKLRTVAGKNLSRKLRELIMLAIDASCTHLFEPGVRAHMSAAIKAGATQSEVLETLELTSVLGLHAVTVGTPLLQEVLEERGEGQQLRKGINLTERQAQLQTALRERKDGDGGFWAGSADALFSLSPAFIEAGLEFTSVPFQRDHQHLDAMSKELIYIAIDCATTYIRQPTLKAHIRNALTAGAKPEQVMDVFELAALMGGQTMNVGGRILGEEFAVRKG